MLVAGFPDFIESVESLVGWLSDYMLAVLAIALLVSANWVDFKRFFGRAKSPDWIYLKDAVDYLTYDAKFSLPTKNRPMEAFLFMSADSIEQAARGRKIRMRGRKENATEFENVDPDFWRLAHFDWGALLIKNGRQAGKSDPHPRSDMPDRPNVSVYVDLEVSKFDLQNVFPSQNRWDKSKLGKWLRNKWVKPIDNSENEKAAR